MGGTPGSTEPHRGIIRPGGTFLNDQFHAVGMSEEVSVNSTTSGAAPEVALMVNEATGAAAEVLYGIIIQHSKINSIPVNDNFLVNFISDSSSGSSLIFSINSCRWIIVESWKYKVWQCYELPVIRTVSSLLWTGTVSYPHYLSGEREE